MAKRVIQSRKLSAQSRAIVRAHPQRAQARPHARHLFEEHWCLVGTLLSQSLRMRDVHVVD